ncbi:hypothetical protein [Streptomyces sp. NPDC058595]|uniref:hypothetical protein n=1 Tax=Streptomyces sp. NPDC058595 TaxID=3346550 RepID=UPI003649EE31
MAQIDPHTLIPGLPGVPDAGTVNAEPQPEAIAQETADRAAHAWHRERAGEDPAVPVGVVATLAQLSRPSGGPDTAAQLRALSPADLWRVLERVWAMRWVERPELAAWAAPLHRWLTSTPSSAAADAVAAVGHAALDAGLLDLTGSEDAQIRRGADVLGPTLARVRPAGAREAFAEIHSPPDVAKLLTNLVLLNEPPAPGDRLGEPTAGSGGLVRATASHLGANGHDVRRFSWSMNEIDPVAAASCASNALTWDLGPDVLVFCGDTLTNSDGPEQARRERADILAHHAELVELAGLTVLTRDMRKTLFPTGGAESPSNAGDSKGD